MAKIPSFLCLCCPTYECQGIKFAICLCMHMYWCIYTCQWRHSATVLLSISSWVGERLVKFPGESIKQNWISAVLRFCCICCCVAACAAEEQEWCVWGADSGRVTSTCQEVCLSETVSHAQDHRRTVPRKLFLLWLSFVLLQLLLLPPTSQLSSIIGGVYCHYGDHHISSVCCCEIGALKADYWG